MELSRRAALALAGVGVAWAATGCSRPGGDDDGATEESTGDVIAYGDDDELQRGVLSRPGGGGPHPVVVLVHGGFWRPIYDRTLMDPLVASVTAQGWAAWNVDYRPSGPGGGWPTTFTDVGRAVDHLAVLADDHALDLDRVAVVGHSAGGTLALWTAVRAGLPADAPGAGPEVVPDGVVSLAGVVNLAAGSFEGLGDGAVDDLMGGDAGSEVGDRYGMASPIERLPLGRPTLLVHGVDDVVVPPTQSVAYRDRAAEAGDEVTLELVADGDHFVVIDPDSDAWAEVIDWLGDRWD